MSQRVPCANFYEEDPFSWSNLCFEGLFVLGLLINLYIIYCILRRSPKNMSTYKWYLLYHQIVTAMADIGVSVWITVAYNNPLFSVQFRGQANNISALCRRLSDERVSWCRTDSSYDSLLSSLDDLLHRHHCSPLLVPLFGRPQIRSPPSSLLDTAIVSVLG